MVVHTDEIGMPVLIESLAWKKTTSGTPSASLDDFKIYMGYCASDELGTVFEDNYVPGTKTLVFQGNPFVLSGSPDQWMPLDLDTPFLFDNSQNLIIDVEWSDGSGTVYVYHWDSGSGRSLSSDYGSPSGYVQNIVSHMQLTGSETAVEETTFGGLKAFLGTQ